MESHLFHFWIVYKVDILVSELEKLNELDKIREGLNSYDVRIFNYHYFIEEGILKKGEVRNVALRAEMLSLFFDFLKKNVKINTDDCIQVIKDAGSITGKDFIFKLENKILNRQAKIKDWIDYDSSAGMGRFLVDKRLHIIEVKNSFIAENIRSEKPVCHFLEGYFEGILSVLLNENVKIKETDCIAKGDKICKFEIERKNFNNLVYSTERIQTAEE